MALPFGQAHDIKRKLISLKCQLQTTGRAHRSPNHNLIWVKPAKPLP
jgi:hypothetical protein